MDKSKPFGLIIPKKAKAFPGKTNAIFDSDSDDEPKKKMPKIPQKPISKKLIEAEKLEDPSIYEYDAIYDDMKAQEKAKLAVPKTENKPSRYIDSLLKAADKRKKNLERRLEKKVQSEREKEGDKFKDKESFVTSSYKKKMQEMEEEEERERRENELNDMMDVTKQKDLSGFYRHFLKQSVGEEKVPVFGERSIKKEPESPPTQVLEVEGEKIDPNLDRDSDISLSSSDDDENLKDSADNKKHKTCSDDDKPEQPLSGKRKIHRQIRKRFDDGSDEEDIEEREKDKERKKDKETKNNSGISRHSGKSKRDEKKKSDGSSESESSSEDETDNSKLNDTAKSEEQSKKDSESNGDEKKQRKNIYEKRTVGNVFTDAQVRYFQRMNSRSS